LPWLGGRFISTLLFVYLDEMHTDVELETIIRYRNFSACYKVQNEAEGIFTANLLYHDVDEGQAPPEGITMVKGIRNWTGSVEDESLLSELGKFIDANWPVRGRKTAIKK
jgi:hypothetical protein